MRVLRIPAARIAGMNGQIDPSRPEITALVIAFFDSILK